MSRKIAFTALFSALGTVALFLTTVLPSGTIALLCASSGFVAFTVLECGMGYGILGYVVISALGFLLVPDKTITLWEFILLLGYYPVVKCLIERLDKLWLEWSLKLVFFWIASSILLWLFKAVLMIPVVTAFSVWLYPIAGVVLLCIYDYALSMILSYYNNRLRRYGPR